MTATVLVLLLSLTAVTLCVADYRELRRGLQMVSVQRRHPPVVGRDLPFDVEWTIQSAAPLPAGMFRDEAPSVAAERFVHEPFGPGRPPVVITRSQRIPVRGVHRLGPAWLRLVGPTACLEAQSTFGDASEVKVLPELYASRDELLKVMGDEVALLDKQVFTRQRGAGRRSPCGTIEVGMWVTPSMGLVSGRERCAPPHGKCID